MTHSIETRIDKPTTPVNIAWADLTLTDQILPDQPDPTWPDLIEINATLRDPCPTRTDPICPEQTGPDPPLPDQNPSDSAWPDLSLSDQRLCILWLYGIIQMLLSLPKPTRLDLTCRPGS